MKLNCEIILHTKESMILKVLCAFVSGFALQHSEDCHALEQKWLKQQISIWQVKPYKLVSDPVFASEDKFKNERFKISCFGNCMLIMFFFLRPNNCPG